MSALKKFKVRVDSTNSQTAQIHSYELVHPDGADLPQFLAGSHIDVHFGNGLIRQYSLSGPEWNRQSYRICVLSETTGTGASEFTSNIRVGDVLEISEPKNLFKLNPNAQRHLLIGSGIGITPIVSMTYSLERTNADYVLHYCARSPQAAAFMDELKGLVKNGKLHLHFDGGNPENGLDLRAALREYPDGTHLYYCGPVGMMSATAEASSHWPEGTVHCEHFSTPATLSTKPKQTGEDNEFQIKVSSTGAIYSVPPHKSIVDVLRENGIDVDTSCEDGFCGSCLTRYLGGEPDHRDEILDEEDHEEYLLICCARSHTPEIILDL